MKTLQFLSKIGFVLAIFLMSSQVSAQGQTPQATSAESMANQLTKYEVEQLKLDAKEAVDLSQINLIYAQRLNELSKKASNENNKNEVEALKRSHNQKVRSLLSSEKYQQYLALKKEEAKKEEDKK